MGVTGGAARGAVHFPLLLPNARVVGSTTHECRGQRDRNALVDDVTGHNTDNSDKGANAALRAITVVFVFSRARLFNVGTSSFVHGYSPATGTRP
jgi:hypothetical protein